MATQNTLSDLYNRKYGSLEDTQSKMDALTQARANKLTELAEFANTARQESAQRAAQEAEQREANKFAVVNQLGLEDGVIRDTVNAGSAFVSTGHRMLGEFLNIPTNAAATTYLRGITDQDMRDYLAAQEGTATLDQYANLRLPRQEGPKQVAVQEPVWSDDPHVRAAQEARHNLVLAREGNAQHKGPMVASPLERIQNYENHSDFANYVRKITDTSFLVDDKNATGLSEAFSKVYEANKDNIFSDDKEKQIDGMLALIGGGVKAGADNPAAVIQHVAANLPQMAVGMAKHGTALMAAFNVGYSLDVYQKGLEEYKEANDGKLPSQAERRDMMAWAVGSGASEQLSDVVGVGGFRALRDALKPVTTNVANVTPEIAKKALRAAAKTPLAFAAGAATEAGTEGFQTEAEAMAAGKKYAIDTDAGPELKTGAPGAEIYEGAATGALVGGVMRGAPTAASQLVSPLKPIADKAKEDLKAKQVAKAERDAAIKTLAESGDVSGLTDPTKKSYSPVIAVEALKAMSMSAAATPEAKEANFKQATSIAKGLDDVIATTQADIAEFSNPTEMQATLKTYQDALADPSTDQSLIPDLQEEIKFLEQDIANAPKRLKDSEAKLKSFMKMKEELDTQITSFKAATEDVVDMSPVETVIANSNDPVELEAAVTQTLNMVMKNPSKVSKDTLESLLTNQNITLNEQQRNYVDSLIASNEAADELSGLGRTSREVLTGGRGNFGVQQYRNTMQNAVTANDQNLADSAIQGLTNFARVHGSKAKAFTDAAAQGFGKQVAPDANGEWSVLPKNVSKSELAALNGMTVNSPKLTAAIQAEAKAINAALSEMASAYALAFNGATPTTQAAPAQSTRTQRITRKLPQRTGVTSNVQNQSPVQASPAQTNNQPTQTTQVASVPQANGQGNGVGRVEPTTTNTQQPTQSTPQVTEANTSAAPLPWEDDVVSDPSDDPTPSIYESLNERSANKGTGKTYTPFGKNESKALTNALNTLTGKLKEIASTIKFVKETGKDRGAAYIVWGAIGLNTGFIKQDDKWAEGMSLQDRVTWAATHEVGHFMDAYSGNFAISKDWLTKPNLLEEFIKAVDNPLAKWMAEYPQRFSKPEELAREVFAQLVALNNYNPEVLNEYYPQNAEWLQSVLETGTVPSSTTNESAGVGSNPEISRESSTDTGLNANTGTSLDNDISATTEVTIEANTSAQDREINNSLRRAEDTDVSPEEAGMNPELGFEVFSRDPEVEKTQPQNKMNLVAAFVKQKANLGLTRSKNFLSKLGNLRDELKGQEFTDKQVASFELFKASMKQWNQVLATKFAANKNPDFAYQSPFEFLLDLTDRSNPKAEENLLTAMSMGAFEFLGANASGLDYIDDKAINNMLGRDDETLVTKAERDLLLNTGLFERTVVNDLGIAFLKYSGLYADKNTPQNLIPLIQDAAGKYMLSMLLERGLLKLNRISAKQFNDALDLKAPKEGETADPLYMKGGYHTFITARDSDGYIFRNTERVMDVYSSISKPLAELTGTPNDDGVPAMEQGKWKQKSIKKTDRAVPKRLQEANEHMRNIPLRVKKTQWEVLKALPKEAFLRMAGFVEVNDSIHADLRKGVGANNNALERAYDNLIKLVDEVLQGDLAKAIFQNPSVWVNNRSGISDKMINIQNSKIHREMFTPESWDQTVDMNNPQQLANFLLRAAEGLGIKTDERSDADNLPSIEKTLADTDSGYPQAIKALQKSLRGEVLTPNDIETIVSAVERAGENTRSLSTLVSLAQYTTAKEAGETSFTTQMTSEVDGKTNGPMLTLAMLGAGNNGAQLLEVLEAGGFYSAESGISQFSQWRALPGNEDLYQDTMRSITHGLNQYTNSLAKDSKDLSTTKAIFYFTGKLTKEDKDNGTFTISSDGRNLVKTPIQAIFFGSGVRRSAESMSDKVVEGIYKKIAQAYELSKSELAEDRAKAEAMRRKILRGLELLGIPKPNMSLNDLQNNELLSRRDLKAISKRFMNTVGTPISKAIEAKYANYLSTRDSISNTTNVMFNVFNSVYNTLREREIQRLIASGELKANQAGQPILDMSKAQEAAFLERVKAIAPIVHSWYSKVDGDLSAGLRLAKQDKAVGKVAAYKGEALFKEGTSKGVPKTVEAVTSKYVEPGVTAISLFAHSFDSRISHDVGLQTDSFNNHDARTSGFNEVVDLGKKLNETTWKGIAEFSPAQEVHEYAMRMLEGINALIDAGELSPQDISNMYTALNAAASKRNSDGPKGEELLVSTVMSAYYAANQANKTRKELIELVDVVDQYPIEGGSYKVDPKAKQEALDSIKIGEDHSMESLDALEKLAPNAVKDYRQAIESGKNPEAKAENKPKVKAGNPAKKSPAPITKTSPYGTLGNPTNAQNERLVQFLEANPNPSFTQLLKATLVTMGDTYTNSDFTEFASNLVKVLGKHGDKNIKVKYVSKNSVPETQTPPTPGALGRYDPATNTIEIVGTDFIQAQVDPTLVIHEAVHAAMFHIIEGAKIELSKLPKGAQPSEQVLLVQDLQRLQREVLKYAEANGLTESFGNAFDNLHELVAWGLTDREFQQEVLMKVRLDKSKLNFGNLSIESGLKTFIDIVTNLLFRGSRAKPVNAKTVNGMALLVANATNLIYQDSTARQASQAGSTTNLNAMPKTPSAKVQDMDTVSVFKALGAGSKPISQVFQQRAEDILTGLVEAVYGPYGAFKGQVAQATDAMDLFIKSVQTGKAPFASELVGAPFQTTHQEQFLMENIEATVRTAIDSKDASVRIPYQQLKKLFDETKRRIKPEDFLVGTTWANASAIEKQEAQDKYDFIFDVSPNANGTSNYLSRFAALGLGSEQVSKLMNFSTNTFRPTAKGSFLSRVQTIFSNFVDMFHKLNTGTFEGQNAEDKLNKLIEALVNIEVKNKRKILRNSTQWSDLAEQKLSEAGKAIKSKAAEFMDMDILANSRFGTIKGAAALTKVALQDRGEEFVNILHNIGTRLNKDRHSLVRGMVTELAGIPQNVMTILLQAKRNNEQVRHDISTGTESAVMGEFINKGKDLTDVQKESITSVLLRSGAHYLLEGGKFTIQQLTEIVGNKQTRDSAINSLESDLTAELAKQGIAPEVKNFLVNSAHALAYYKATGLSASPWLLRNAHAISSLIGLNSHTVTPQQVKAIEPIVAQLVSAYTINMSRTGDLNAVTEVMRKELTRGNNANGVAFLLGTRASMEKRSIDTLFGGNPMLMEHGYTPEILDPSVEHRVASGQEVADLELQGWEKVHRVPRDSSDPRTPTGDQYLLVLKGAGLGTYQSGAFSMMDLASKGTKLHGGFYKQTFADRRANAAANASMTQVREQYAESLLKQPNKPNLFNNKRSYMVPILNANGEVSNYAYMMSHSTKDTVLRRDNRFEKVMGAYAGANYAKTATLDSNLEAVEALKESYDTDYAQNPDAYVLVGRESTDPALKEAWDLLPEQTKKDIKAIWKQDGMRVRAEVVDVLFGYRKYSLADMFEKEPDARNFFENQMVNVIEWMFKSYGSTRKGLSGKDLDNYAKRATNLVSRGEKVWQEIVKEIKDIIVVKSGFVLAGNIISNTIYLWANGVPLKNIATDSYVAFKAAQDYAKDIKELDRLMLIRDGGYFNYTPREIEQAITEREDSISRNPVKSLIEAGLMPSIVDDVSMEDDPYSYKSALTDWVETKTDRLPEVAKGAAKQVYMAKGTAMNNFMSSTTQLSDFTARYVLYQYQTTRKVNPLSHEDAVLSASESFINYDIPLPKALQYTDDMGLTMFTKYFLRVQKIIYRQLRDRPLRTVSTIALGKYVDGLSMITDSAILGRLGNNPFFMGPLAYPETLGDLATVSAAMSIVK